jgi:endo-1,3-1,4-beta-glycanase ExoK
MQGMPAPQERAPLAPRLVVACVVGGLVVAVVGEAVAARRPPVTSIIPLGSFVDALGSFDSTRWIKADRWTNGSPFDNAWRADHVVHDAVADAMHLRLTNRAFLGEPYSAGEYRTRGFHGYGCYEARFRPIAQPGVVTSFFTFAGPHDNGGNGRHNEIDVEFLGYDTRRVQFNFWTNDDTYAQRNETLLDLGFDAAAAAHNYGFRWTATSLEWYVDGNRVHSFIEGPGTVRVPKTGESYQKIMMNAWPVDASASGWAGTFRYEGERRASYEWVRYDASTECGFTSAGAAPGLLP